MQKKTSHTQAERKSLMWDKGVTNCLKPQLKPNVLLNTHLFLSLFLELVCLLMIERFVSRSLFSHLTHLIKAIYFRQKKE